MKKLSLALLTILLVASCSKEHSKDYISLSGELTNNKDSLVTISSRTGIIKTISIDKNGSFKDTLTVTNADIYTLQTNSLQRIPLYLKNGFDISLKGDSEDFMSSVKYSGTGADNSQLIIAHLEQSKKIGNPADILALDKASFTKKIDLLKKSYDSILTAYNDLDSSLVSLIKTQNKQMFDYFDNTYSSSQKMAKGKVSPKFENYTDFKGGKKSLDSFKGKYVYIDVWATWCGPCIREIPSLKALEKEYHNKNIEFISISTDESRRSGGSWEAAEKKWRDFVKDKQLSGVQLWAGQDFSFQQAYQITGIPRFILIDTEGKIVDSNAPRPSDPRLKTLLNSIL
ncbi:TlpA family protein disulfide reductase [Polaribacter sargassicola]|uniref:TlpA family protein disulfide reductase n=1 Tax=Polaribacter sargassicola TaxID=2836891 RepID=UPI001F414EFB|nr:TlpA disulfide reductase family protein [Polaribacter sp. DS7-9]MCG1037406.1 TlpA family protein disulfide reductase [Polaribacter sp. DS7-9]